jgi:hypothetical protein
MACDSAARAEGAMTDPSGIHGVSRRSALLSGTMCMQSYPQLGKLAAGGLILQAIHQ